MFEHSGRLISALFNRIGSWDWTGAGESASILHGFFTALMVLLLAAGCCLAIVKWFACAKKAPVKTLIWTFVIFTIVLFGIQAWGNDRTRQEARQELRLRNSRQAPDRVGITYQTSAPLPKGGQQTIICGTDNWIPIFRNQSGNMVIIEISAGGSLLFYGGNREKGLKAWIFDPDGLTRDPAGDIRVSDPGRLQDYPAPNLPTTFCALVGKVEGCEAFLIGRGPVRVVVGPKQTVYATSNDRWRKDNSGPNSHYKWWVKVSEV